MLSGLRVYLPYPAAWMFFMMRRSVAFDGEPLVTAPS